MTSPLSGEAPILVLLAHPDDEFALFPWLGEAVRMGRQVVAVWLTDGGWGGQPLEPRRRESMTVLSRLGLAAMDMHFLGERHGIADGSLMHHADAVAEHVLALAGGMDRRPAQVWMPAWEGGHQDHDAAHLVGLKVAASLAAGAWQFPLYNGWKLRGPWFRVLLPLPANGAAIGLRVSLAERLRCIARCLQYRSQWRSFMGLLPFYVLSMLRREPFRFQRCDADRARGRPHDGALLYERRNGPSWSEFLDSTASIRNQLADCDQRSSESIQNVCQFDGSNRTPSGSS